VTCPPKPGFQLVALALLMLAFGTASLLSRRQPGHGPVAWALGLVLGADLVRTGLSYVLPCDGPYRGLDRAAFNVDEGLWLLWPVVLAWLPLRVLGVVRDPRLLNAVAVASWVSLAITVGLLYPALRGDPLRQLYLASELAGLLVACGAMAAWVGRGGLREGTPRPATLVAALLVAVELSQLAAGAWTAGLFGEAYTAEQAALCALYGVVTLVQGGAWWMARRAPS
jgi:hypothetical protein